MNTADSATAPIYDRLIAERGDAVAVASQTAEQTRRATAEVLDFGALGTGLGTAGAAGDEDSKE
ncbi:hypothetical protein ACSLFT_34635 (plasmid) [Streptomyces sp. G6]|uniref:hypothetical protein n=1 Tax=unclassified Streptomyces TaxID=2593676 RepID=UPI003598667F